MAILFAFISLAGWAVGDVFVTIVTRRIGSAASYFWGYLFGLILLLFCLPFVGGVSDWGMLGIAFLLNIIRFLGSYIYFRGLEKGNASLTGAIGGSFPVVTVILSVILFKEQLSTLQILGIGFTVIGIIFSSVKLEGLFVGSIKRKDVFDKSMKYGLATMLLWGFFYALIRVPVYKIGWFWAQFPLYIIGLCIPFFTGLRVLVSKTFQSGKILLMIIVFIILVSIADFSFNIGITKGYTAVVAPVAGSSPVLFVILSKIFLREKLSRSQNVGVVFALIGIIILSFASI